MQRTVDTLSGAAGALSKLRAALPAMTPAERRAAEWVLTNPGEASQLTAQAVAEAAGVGFGSVIRACTRAGYREYGALKTALAVELLVPASITGTPVPALMPADPAEEVLRSVLAAVSQSVLDTAQTVNPAAFERVVAALSVAFHVAVLGAGSVSGACAQLLQVRLMGAGVSAASYPHSNDHVACVKLLGPGDVVLGISQSGETASVAMALSEASAVGAVSVAITAYGQSIVARSADQVLVTAVAPGLRGEPATSRVPLLALVDVLAVGVLLKRQASEMASQGIGNSGT
jgi:DNA-binding MurR/RpiR family transcriptional regulator